MDLKKIINEEPIANEEVIVNEEPIANEEVIVNEEPVVNEKPPNIKPGKKLFCPPFMFRYDVDPQYFEYKTFWSCRVCYKMLLNKEVAIIHAQRCKPKITNKEDVPLADLLTMIENKKCPCKYCDDVMEEVDEWIAHLNNHETEDVNSNDWGIDLPDDRKI